jgi:hypothetical protein
MDEITGGSCGNHAGMMACHGGLVTWVQKNLPSRLGGGMAGQTFGFPYFSANGQMDNQIMHHESVHRQQYLDQGISGFLVGYMAGNFIYGRGSANPYEQEAGLGDGCYMQDVFPC